MEKVATDTFSFGELRTHGYVYVDKTAILNEFAGGSRGKLFFIARPRRFGKSLAVSTLRCLFEGRRELFRGLAIEPLWDWSKKWPVIHLDMGTMQYDSIDDLSAALKSYLKCEGERLGVAVDTSLPPPEVFRRLIRDVAATAAVGQCVVLIDEYDKPLLKALNTPDVTRFRDFLKPFYGVIKYEEGLQRFAFITGVSKFSKVSIFSDLNNLKDYTMNAVAATLFGYTHEEVRRYFPANIAALGKALNRTEEEAFGEIVKWYDGYKFHPDAEPVINPVSLGMTFDAMEMNNWWSKTAVPTFLVDFLKAHPLDVSSLSISESDLDAYEPERINPVTLLFQTGYLTIRGFEQIEADRTYTLRFPNLEVENSFLKSIVGVYVGKDESDAYTLTRLARNALLNRDPEGFVKAFRSFFNAIPYDLTDRQNEQTWQAIIYVVLRTIGINVRGEVRTHDGRIDLTVETPTDVYIIEVKRDRSAKKAIEQIREKSYTDKFRLSGKPITLVGIAFSSKKRTVSGVQIVRDA